MARGLLFKVVGLASVAAVVAACGISTLNYNYERQSYGSGESQSGTFLNLLSGIGGLGITSEPGSAKLKIDGKVWAGNTVLTGSFSDGPVKFNFSGYPIPNVDFVESGGFGGDPCVIPIIGSVICSGSVNSLLSPAVTGGVSVLDSSSPNWMPGGCDLWLTNYKSTNRSMPDYGIAAILVCDKQPDTNWWMIDSTEVPGDYFEVLLVSDYEGSGPFNGFYAGGFTKKDAFKNKWRVLDAGPVPSMSTSSSAPPA